MYNCDPNALEETVQGFLNPHYHYYSVWDEAEELVTEALVRVAQEEAGVQISAIGQLVALSQIDHPADACQTLAFVFEIAEWQGTLQCQDPDGKVHSVELVEQVEAISRLQRTRGWPGIQEPVMAYLRGEVHEGTIWFYRDGDDGQRLLATLPAPHVGPDIIPPESGRRRLWLTVACAN